MPTKIVLTPSDPIKGEINLGDLNKIIVDFDKDVQIQSPPNRLISKTTVISIPKIAMDTLLKDVKDEEWINIKFGVSLPNQMSCDSINPVDISNALTVVLVIANAEFIKNDAGEIIDNKPGIEKIQPDNFILTPGFRNCKEGGGVNPVDICCGSIG